MKAVWQEPEALVALYPMEQQISLDYSHDEQKQIYLFVK